MKLDTIVCSGAEKAAVVLRALVHRSQHCACIPLPDGYYELQFKPENRPIVEAFLPKHNLYTVVLLYPDYSTADYGGETYMASMDAPDEAAAVKAVQSQASQANDGDIRPEDFRAILVFQGSIE